MAGKKTSTKKTSARQADKPQDVAEDGLTSAPESTGDADKLPPEPASDAKTTDEADAPVDQANTDDPTADISGSEIEPNDTIAPEQPDDTTADDADTKVSVDQPDLTPEPDPTAEDATKLSAEADQETKQPEPAPEERVTTERDPETSTQTDTVAEPEPEVRAPPKQDPPPSQNSFIPMLLGGLLAGGIGFGAAYYGLTQTTPAETFDPAALETALTEQIAAQSEQISALSDQVEQLPPPADLAGIEAGQANLTTSIDEVWTRLTTMEDQLAAIDTRLSDVEKRPITEGASDAAVAAYERELQALQEAMASQRAEIESMMSDAAAMEQSAAAMAQATQQRAALAEIQTALDTGAGFAPALAELEATGMTAPDALSAVAEEGAATLSSLQSEFPAAARAALAASRQSAAVEGETGGFGSFLRSQLGARSLEPREGNDPDAVLSRAEAAAREGRLQDALTEIEALPAEGQAPLAAWVSKVAARSDAVSAAEALSQELN